MVLPKFGSIVTKAWECYYQPMVTTRGYLNAFSVYSKGVNLYPLLSEDGSVELVDKIGEAIEILRGNSSQNQEENQPEVAPGEIEIADTSFDDLKVEHVYLDERGTGIETATEAASKQDNGTENRRGKTWTEDEENLIRLYFQQGKDFITIASLIGRTEVAIKSRLAKLGHIDYTYGQDNDVSTLATQGAKSQTDESDFVIENLSDRAVILDQDGKPMFIRMAS